uniref:Replication protein n=1 Tax=Dependoparvovirus sp. TaxID=2052559 RepID=A0A6M9Z836_9VIRU|nr:MAG: replication protein [Dependoparvovirus sp.]
MTSFFEIVVRLPNDFYAELPGISDAWVDNICEENLHPPDTCDFNLDLVEPPYVALAERIRQEINLEWSYRAGPHKFFIQLEKGEENYHIHVLLEPVEVKSFVFGRYLPGFKERIKDRVYAGIEPQTADWFEAAKVKKGGANALRHVSYITNYLLPKKQPELQWAWTNLEEFRLAALNLHERARLVEEQRLALEERHKEATAPTNVTPRVGGKSAERYMALVNWLVTNGITSEKEWIQADQESYLTHNANSNSRAQIKTALDNASRIMQLTKTACDYLIGPEPPADVTTNRVYRIFEMNGYDPQLAGSILLGWANRRFGKRNAIWLFGPATTGKTNIAEAIAHAVPFYGCVNWTNENFPFNDCVNKMLIWWEEGKMTAKIVESAKSILGGSRVRVDQKCKSSQQIDSTPVIITSNTDMTMVVDGNTTTFEHREALEDRMFQFYLGKRLDNDFGKITKTEVREFFKWAELNPTTPPHVFRVPRVNDAGYKRPDSPAASSYATERPSGEEPAAKRPRYEHKPVDNGRVEKSTLDLWLEGNPTPAALVVHDLMEASGSVFDMTVRECPDSNKEQ